MKTNSIVFCAALMVSLVASPALFAQYPGQLGPGYGQPVSGMGQVPMQQAMMGYAPAMHAAPIGTSMVPMMAQPVYHQAPQNYAPVVPASYDTLFGDENGPKYGKGGCGGKCGGKGCNQCLTGGYSCRLSFYGEFLYMRVRDQPC